MDLKLHIIHAKEFIRAAPTGELDWNETRKMLDAMGAAAQGRDDYAIMIDLRQIDAVNLTTAEVWELADRLIIYGPVFANKTALLLPAGAPGDRARFFELCARNRGFQISVFSDFEQAIWWLAAPITELSR